MWTRRAGGARSGRDDRANHHVSHVVVKDGHVFTRKDVAVPIDAVETVSEQGIRLTLSKQEIEDLPQVNFRHRRH